MSKPCILLIEDNEGDVTLVREALNTCAEPFELRVSNHADEALAYLQALDPEDRENWPDLIMLDYNLPKLSGLDVLKFLKGNENLRIIPTLIYSSSDYQKDVLNAYKEYANSYVIKPTDIDDFCRTVSIIWRYWFRTVRLPNPKYVK